MNSTTSTTKKTCTVNGTDSATSQFRPTRLSTLTHTAKPLFGTIELTSRRRKRLRLFFSYSRSTIKKSRIHFELCSLNRNFAVRIHVFNMIKMRKLLFIAAALLFGSMSLHAQEQEMKHEIAVGGGFLSNSEVLDMVTEVATIAGTAGSYSYDNEKFRNPFSVEYYYHISPLIGVGGIAVYAHGKRDIMLGNSLEGNLKTSYLTVMPAVKINWLRKSYWGLYSKAGAGVSFRTEKTKWYAGGLKNETNNDVIFNFQATAIGVECGSENYRGFIELGMGEQGIVNTGVKFRF